MNQTDRSSTLAGLRSRWTTPARVGRSDGVGYGDRDLQRLREFHAGGREALADELTLRRTSIDEHIASLRSSSRS